MIAAIEPSNDSTIVTLVPVERTVPEAYRTYQDLFTCNERLPLPDYYAIEYYIDLMPSSEPL